MDMDTQQDMTWYGETDAPIPKTMGYEFIMDTNKIQHSERLYCSYEPP